MRTIEMMVICVVIFVNNFFMKCEGNYWSLPATRKVAIIILPSISPLNFRQCVESTT